MGRPPIGKHAMSGSERQRRYLDRLLHGAKSARTPSDASTQELAQAKAQTVELESKLAQTEKRLAGEQARVHALLTEIAELDRVTAGARFAPKPRAPKAVKPPLPPDEEREKIIKGLRTRVRNLTRELNAVRTWRGHDGGGMDFATMSAIAKALHPDAKPSEEQRAEAMRRFTDWKSDKEKARRRTR